jgi:hypothetical protein
LSGESDLVIEDLTKLYQDYSSTKADGRIQAALNGDGKTMLVDCPTVRNGQKYRSARFKTPDRLGVFKLNQARINRVVSAAKSANAMRTLSFTRHPELAGEVNEMFAAGLKDVGALMGPASLPALPAAPTPPADTTPAPPADTTPAAPTDTTPAAPTDTMPPTGADNT